MIVDARSATDFLNRLHGAVNVHDADAIAALCSETVRWEDPAAAEPLSGREAVRHFHREVMFRALPDVTIDLVDGPYLADDGLAVRLRIRGTMTGWLVPPGFAPTGGLLEFETAEFSRLDDEGLLARHTVILDMLGLARQIGAVPAAGSIGDRVGVWLQHRVAAARKRRVPSVQIGRKIAR